MPKAKNNVSEEDVIDDVTGEAPIEDDFGFEPEDDPAELPNPEDGEDDDEGKTGDPLKDTQRAYHEAQKTNKILTERLARMEGKLEGMEVGKPKKEDYQNMENPFAFIEDKGLRDKMLDDPGTAVELVDQTVSGLMKVLSMQDKYWQDRFKKVEDMANRPTDPKVNDRIRELREDPDFEDFTDAQLAKLAKKGIGREARAKPREYPGKTPSGSRVTTGAGRGDTRFQKLVKHYEQQMDGV